MGAFESLECSKASSCDCAQHDDVFPSLMMERPKSQPSYLDWRSAAIIDLSATLKPQLQKNTSSDMEAVMHEAEQVRLRVEDLLSSDSVARLPKRLSFGGSTSSWPGNGVGVGRSLACLGLYSTLAAVLVVIKSNHVSCEECISGSMRYITSSYMAIAFGSRPPWSSLHGLGEDSTASLNIRVLRPKREWFRLRCSLHHKSCIETKYLRVYRVVLYHLTPSLAGIKLFAGYQPYLAVGKYARWAYD